jgi:hypothetical protein
MSSSSELAEQLCGDPPAVDVMTGNRLSSERLAVDATGDDEHIEVMVVGRAMEGGTREEEVGVGEEEVGVGDMVIVVAVGGTGEEYEEYEEHGVAGGEGEEGHAEDALLRDEGGDEEDREETGVWEE